MDTHPKNMMLLELVKSYVDYFKHITTLNTGCILIIIALLEGVFENPKGLFLIAVSIFFFVVSLVCSLVVMKIWLNYAEHMIGYIFTNWGQNKDLFRQKIKSAISLKRKLATYVILAFLLGVFFLLGFTAINFFR